MGDNVAFLKNGKKVNLFAPADMKKDFLSVIGWGSLLGIMKNYDLINPFVSATTDAFMRLQPGFEAPTHAVASIGKDVLTPSRNRTVLLGLVRSENNSYATRFELRSPNPHTNTYLCLSAIHQCMLDGIDYALKSGKSTSELEAEFVKDFGVESDYLEKDKPATVYDSLSRFLQTDSMTEILCAGDVFNDMILTSYSHAMLDRWQYELLERIIPSNLTTIRTYVKKHTSQNTVDDDMWNDIENLKLSLAKNSS